MEIVMIAALTVGGGTILGASLGALFNHISPKANSLIIAFAAGVMLSTSIVGLILPAVSFPYGGSIIASVGILLGVLFLESLQKLLPVICTSFNRTAQQQTVLFVLAIAIHNFPEGLAAGISFGTGNYKTAFLISGGIALQNIPEGFVTVTPLVSSGMNKHKSLFYGILTGIVEIFSTLLGYITVSVSSVVLPTLLAFAGGTMIYVIFNDMIPEMYSHKVGRSVSYSFMVGFCVMLFIDFLLG